MYNSYFKLEENPFSLTPDPRFLFLSKRHREGIAHLLYGMGESGGFVLLTGEVGTGKTTLYRSVLEQAPDNVDVALILNPRQSAHELLSTICDELQVAYDRNSTTIQPRVNALNQYLLDAHARGRRTVLIIDEAQNLEVSVLEQIRLLTNLETSKAKLLQIILVGQPELKFLLSRPDLRQLNQRITARYHLMPLNKHETAAYVKHRLSCAGVTRPLFKRDALATIHRLSGGVPRLINIICERSLLAGYAEEQEQISAQLVKKAAREAIGNRGLWRRKYLLLMAGSFALILIATVALYLGSILPGNKPAPMADNSKIQLASPVLAIIEGTPPHADNEQPIESTEQSSEPATKEISLAELLETDGIKTDTDTAFGTLFKYWGLDYATLPGNTPCRRAEKAGLRCIREKGNLNNVRLYERPSIFRLTDKHGINHHVILSELGDEYATLDFGTEKHQVKRNELESLWYGNYVLLWRPPSSGELNLKPGTRGPEVLWLRKQLDRVAKITRVRQPDPEYDDQLKRRVEAFQRAHGLPADGIAGELTLLKLNSLTAIPPVPRLSQRIQ